MIWIFEVRSSTIEGKERFPTPANDAVQDGSASVGTDWRQKRFAIRLASRAARAATRASEGLNGAAKRTAAP
jgi:hypothetical protein